MLFHLQETGVIPTEEFPGSWPGGEERVGDPGGIKGCEEVKTGLGSGSHGTGPRCVYGRGDPLFLSLLFLLPLPVALGMDWGSCQLQR